MVNRIGYTLAWLQVTVFACIWMYYDQQEALGHGIVFNQWDLLTAVTMNTYLLIYDVLLLVLVLSIARIQSDLTENRLIRFRDSRSALLHSTCRFAKVWGTGLLLYGAVGYIFTLQAPSASVWSLAARTEQVFYVSKDSLFFDLPPLIAHLLQLVFLFTGGLLIHLLLGLVYLWTKRPKLLYLLASLLFLGTGLAFKIGLPSPFFLLSLAALLEYQAYDFWTGCVLVIGAGLLLLDRPIRLPQSGGAASLYLVCCVMIFLMQPVGQTYGDYLIAVFSGTASENFSFQPYLNHAVLFFGYTYLLTQRFERDVIQQGMYHIIRHQSLNRWFLRQFSRLIMTAVLTATGLVVLATGFAFIRGVKWMTEMGSLPIRITTLLYHTVVNGSLQLIVYGLILFLVLYWTREAVQGMYWIGGAMVALLPFVRQEWMPVGLNGTVRLLDHSAVSITIQLVLTGLFVLTVIQLAFRRQIRTTY